MGLKKVKKLHGRGARVQYKNENHPEWDWTTDRTGQEDPFTGYKHLIFRIHPEDKGKFKANWSTTNFIEHGIWHEVKVDGQKYLYKRDPQYFTRIGNGSVHIETTVTEYKTSFEQSIDKSRILYPKEIETLYTKYPEAKPKPKVEWITDIDSLENCVWHELILKCGESWFANGNYFKRGDIVCFHISDGLVLNSSLNRLCYKSQIQKARILSYQEVQDLYTKYPEAIPEENKAPGLLEKIKAFKEDKDSFKVGDEVYVKGVLRSRNPLHKTSIVEFPSTGPLRAKTFLDSEILRSK